MARTARTIWQLEQRLQTLFPLGREGNLGANAHKIRSGPGYGERPSRQHGGSSAHERRWRVKKNGSQSEQALGRSRGGFSTKIHVVVDALGNPLRFILTGGQRHDITQAEALIDSFQFEHVVADKAYDANSLLETIADSGAEAVIPPSKNRTEQRDYDKHLYKERHLVECFINKIKWYRRIATRYDKLAQRYAAFLHLAGALIWLR